MKKNLILSFILILIFVTLSGCDKQDADYVVYMLASDEKTLTEGPSVSSGDASEMVENMIGLFSDLSSDQKVTSNGTALLPEGVEVLDYHISSGDATLNFSSLYNEMDAGREILARAGIVKSLMQISQMQSVTFLIEGQALLNASGEVVGPMDEDTFVANPGRQINSVQTAQLTLYFATQDGKSLTEENRTVHYLSNVSLARLIVEQIIDGTQVEALRSTLSPDTNLISVQMSEGVCYVNFSDSFLTHVYDVNEEVVIYSIVNSLCSIDSIQQVQIMVNGETDILFRDSVDLSSPLTFNTNLISENTNTPQTEVELTDETN